MDGSMLVKEGEKGPSQIPKILDRKNNRNIECRMRGYRGLQRGSCMQEGDCRDGVG